MNAKQIAKEIYAELALLDNEAVTSIARLISAHYGEEFCDNLSQSTLFDITNAFYEIADADKNILIDNSENEGKTVGLPYNVTFVVRKNKAN